MLNANKLELYLGKIEKGFILLSTNESRYQQELLKVISAYGSVITYDLRTIELRSSIEEVRRDEQIKRVVYYNFPKEEVQTILGKLNLLRDLLLEEKKVFILIVPKYIEQIIQRDFPNLYSYFVLKENYTKEYDNFFEYILPGKEYLITKELQRESKKHFKNETESIDKRLNYYKHAKMNDKELLELLYDVLERVKQIEENVQVDDSHYVAMLLFKIGKVFLAQEKFEYAIRTYLFLIERLKSEGKIANVYYDSMMSIGDAYFMCSDYVNAQKYYQDTLIEIAKAYHYDFSSLTEPYRIKIYSRLALCYAGQKDYLGAHEFMRSVMSYIQHGENQTSQTFFDVYYNYFLIIVKMEEEEYREMDEVLDILKDAVRNDVQRAMYLTVLAWYRGTVYGDVETAIELSQKALKIKREIFIENDFRIAESHYVNGVLFKMFGDEQRAKHCCQKCVNILKNFEHKKHQYKLVKKLLVEI